MIDRTVWRTHHEARLAILHYLEGFYNRTGRHSAIEYLSPDAYEARYHAQAQSPAA